MELRHLRYFSAVAEQLCFREAAQRLRVSHPSLCQQIRDLEREVGAALFERRHSRVALTEPGHTFLAGARRTLQCALQTLEATRQIARGHRGELRIGTIGLLCPALLVGLIRAFGERFPDAQVCILPQTDVEGLDAVLERVQLGIGHLTAALSWPAAGALQAAVIATAPVGVAAAATRMPKNRGAGKLGAFARQPFLMLEPKYAPGYREWARSVFRHAGFEPVRTVPVDSAEAFFTLLRAGAGVALLSELHLQGQSEGLRFRRLTESEDAFALSAVWDAQRAGPLVQNFLSVVKQVLAKPNASFGVDGASGSVFAAANGLRVDGS